jgi:ADP-ribose pyrophosphatase YjhB (NUDIX family)
MMASDPRAGVPQWLHWARSLAAIAQAGLTYAQDPFDRERYEQIRRLGAKIAATHTGQGAAAIEGFYASQTGYPTPKLDVRAAVIHEGRILLVREREDDAWALPGGWADIGEGPARAAERETAEEAGVDVRAVKLIALLDREQRGHPPHPEYSYKALFACIPLSADPRPQAGAEIKDAGFFAPGRLPPLSLPRTLPEQIELAFAHAADPALATIFD